MNSDAQGNHRFAFDDLPQDGVVEAKMFILKDNAGNHRACLGTNESGHPILGMFDPASRSSASISLDEFGPFILLQHSDDSNIMVRSAKDTVQVVMTQSDRRTRIVIAVTDGKPSLTICEADGFRDILNTAPV